MTARTIHHLLIAEAPVWVLEEIEKGLRGFLWAAKDKANGGQCLVAWDQICKPREFGGLGIRNLRLQGLALRMRWEWLRRTDHSKPWQGLPMLNDEKAREAFDSMVRIDTGSGKTVLFWRDRWIQGRAAEDFAPGKVKRKKKKEKSEVQPVGQSAITDANGTALRTWTPTPDLNRRGRAVPVRTRPGSAVCSPPSSSSLLIVPPAASPSQILPNSSAPGAPDHRIHIHATRTREGRNPPSLASRMDGNANGTNGSGCKSCGPLTDYYIPDYILKPDSEPVLIDNAPSCPVVVFINSRSGGQLGSGLIKTYRELLNVAQVFDLSEESPDKVLHRLYANFEKLKSNGDILAVEIQRKLRLIVAGGDGTASWLLGVVSDLKLSHPPPVATVPLGTGNNLPFSFGWGKKNPATDQEAVKSFLGLVKGAGEMSIDSWHIIMRMRVPQEGPCDPIAPLELPHSLHAFHRVSGSDELNVEGYHTFRGGFWNYFSMGMDAQVSYGFHSERKKNPEKFKNQLTNQGTYAKLGLKQGWFAPSLTHSSSRNIAQLAKVKIMKRPGGRWEDLKIPSSIRSIICLNLPSFSGGFNPWGTPGTRKAQDRDLTAPYVDDGLIEVVGFRDAWHGLVLLSSKGHGTRLAQAHRIRFEFHKGAADHTFMRVDGEPWKQPLPKDDETVVVEISHLRQVTMLANQPCKSKSIDDPTSPSHRGEDNDDSDSLEDEDEWKEGRKKFGAADTFKLPDEVDMAHLS
ncbi:hypothetical protein ACQ4PT_069629 [Festuca glaucescens]